MERNFLLFFVLFFLSTPIYAGNGFYLGGDVLVHNLSTSSSTLTNQSNPVSNSASYGRSDDTTTNLGFRSGYKYKNRLTDRYFWAPEFSIATFNSSVIYSTNLKFGYEFAPFELYSSFGVSRIDKFTDNRLNLSLGLEYRLGNQTSVNVELTHYDNINEQTSSTSVIGLNTITINTNTVREINSLKIGFTYYFQGSL